uniref:Uncharacterized protein n=1 Tax=Meloidogyne enterolobii TaxID=390850 RepID=A0A6V7Y6Y0_MELEN|nr:unnamed protein product [Meloidogyne enterolobii]
MPFQYQINFHLIFQVVRTLGPDGVFILHQISLNIGELPASYLTLAMYNLMDSGENESRHLLAGEKTPQKHPV